jgi:hypothetical protein
VEYRVAADQDSRKAGYIEVRQGLPEPEPRYGDRQPDKTDSSQFEPLQVIALALPVVMRVRFRHALPLPILIAYFMYILMTSINS